MKTEIIQHLPDKAGIYLFKDKEAKVIYIGKAKSLKKRVLSYFQKTNDWKVAALLQEQTSVDYILTKNETEALLLEAQMVKEHQPKFNVLLKSGQPFLYVLMTHEELPRVELVRNKKKKGIYFGPFLHKRQARSAYQYLIETFRLEFCTVKIAQGCLRYHIGICAGMCKSDFDPQDYIFRLQTAISLLEGNFEQSQKNLKNKIEEYSRAYEFEKAKKLHEYMNNLEIIFETLKTKFHEKKYEKDIAIATAPVEKKTRKPDSTLSEKLQALLKAEKSIHTIDCFDISHFQSQSMVGSCIRFTDGIPDKDFFRRFNIKTLTQQNDYAALQEVVMRRYKNKNELPDLILIDGGKGQLNAIKKILPTALIISLAKQEETLYIDTQTDGIVLSMYDELGRLFIALRDYAHHFAISYHRLKRSKDR